ncbi:hypothetical protein BGZ94_004054, partial [Podila epigama]
MSQAEDGGPGRGGDSGAPPTTDAPPSTGTLSGNGEQDAKTSEATDLMRLIRERQDAAGSTQILDLSYANLDVFPTEIEFLRDVLE